LASAGWTKKAGVPVEASVAAILEPIWPLLPTPVTMTRPSMREMMSTAWAKGSASPFSSAAANAATPACSVATVLSAEAIEASKGFFSGDPACMADALSALPFACPTELPSGQV
jgi:hypothetical protein